MTEFKAGDQVRVVQVLNDPSGANAGRFLDREGRIVREVPGRKYALDVDLGSPEGIKFFSPQELELVSPPRFVNTLSTIWVTLPGDNAGHRLTNEQARQLLRELEEVV